MLCDTGGSYLQELSVKEWCALNDHPRRRDTERQAAKAHWKSLGSARGAVAEALRWVSAAELNRKLYKVDGHTRALLWGEERLTAPASVFATVYRCSSVAELNELYATFDTQSASETLYDSVTGAFHEQGLELRSKRLRGGSIVDALSIATTGRARNEDKSNAAKDNLDVYQAVSMFRKELQLLDAVDPQPDVFHTGVVAAALLSLAQAPSNLEFFRLLSANRGEKKMGMRDPVESVLWSVQELQKAGRSWEKDRQVKLCAQTLRAIDTWNAGHDAERYWSDGPLEPASLPAAVARLRESKRTTGARR